MAATPRFPLLAVTPTPLQPMDRLGRELGFVDGALWVKRDDLTGLAGGGNKARKLEFLVAAALAEDCDMLVTAGAAQSNHVRMTGAAARIAGMACTAVLRGSPPPHAEGNLVLDHLLGIDLVWIGDNNSDGVETVLTATCQRLRDEGRRPYEIPLGGASPLGTLGYVDAAGELEDQAPSGSTVVTATGTGGTQAGLVVGFGDHSRVLGVDVGALPDVAARIEALIPSAASLAGRPLPEGVLQLDADQIGAGYGQPTDSAHEALELAARLEGLVVDPVYSGKALAGLVAARRDDRIAADHPTVFVHTGGTPTLYTDRFRDWFST